MQQALICMHLIPHVLSKSVSDAFKYFANTTTIETEKVTLSVLEHSESQWVEGEMQTRSQAIHDDPGLEVL